MTCLKGATKQLFLRRENREREEEEKFTGKIEAPSLVALRSMARPRQLSQTVVPRLHRTGVWFQSALVAQPAIYPTIIPRKMQLILVQVHVKPEHVEAFKAATIENVERSLHEPGVTQFEFCQCAEDSTHFVLIEGYRGPESVSAHKETSHYKRWRDAVAPMMAVPRSSFRLDRLCPAV
jgi:quinol monooxygenase YgiN